MLDIAKQIQKMIDDYELPPLPHNMGKIKKASDDFTVLFEGMVCAGWVSDLITWTPFHYEGDPKALLSDGCQDR